MVLLEISQLKMADDQADASAKYAMNGRGPQGAAKYWPTILKAIELVSDFDSLIIPRLHFKKITEHFS